MNIPNLVSKNSLRSIDTGKDTHAVRVVLHDANNPSAFRLECHARTYLFERNGEIGKHVLDVPVSVWMHGTSGGRFETAPSISEDFRSARGASLSFQVIPLRTAAATEGPGEVVSLLRKLLGGIGAPATVQHTFALIEAGASVPEIRKFIEQVLESIDDETPEETPSQAKARKMREAKAAKKALATA